MSEYYGVSEYAAATARGNFIRKTYLNLSGALAAFAILLGVLSSWEPAIAFAGKMVTGNNWLLVLLAFMGVSWIASKWSVSSTGLSTQYLGLSLYVFAEAVIFLPLIVVARAYSPESIPQAAVLTGALVLGLSFAAFFTKKDFSFLGSFLTIGSFVALGLIVCSILFGFQLGMVFSGAMIVFAAAAVLYQTSSVIRDYSDSQYVAAALGLFAAVALLFWYILQILISSRK